MYQLRKLLEHVGHRYRSTHTHTTNRGPQQSKAELARQSRRAGQHGRIERKGKTQKKESCDSEVQWNKDPKSEYGCTQLSAAVLNVSGCVGSKHGTVFRFAALLCVSSTLSVPVARSVSVRRAIEAMLLPTEQRNTGDGL